MNTCPSKDWPLGKISKKNTTDYVSALVMCEGSLKQHTFKEDSSLFDDGFNLL